MISITLKPAELSPEAKELIGDAETLADKHIGSLRPEEFKERAALIGFDGGAEEEDIDEYFDLYVDIGIIFPQLQRDQIISLVDLQLLKGTMSLGIAWSHSKETEKFLRENDLRYVEQVQKLDIKQEELSAEQAEILGALLAFN